ncbi:unnamed protein product [Dibothriocephalus latus]|uniref:Phosphatidylinositol transfer protein N-terminal domain-containing protein n=1 Tax=Dibothriocephalus latus TaxID=60516 RepID=A0A3P7P941_DIBLA|nr:unnamed protein product [Dibothriocephalus latus]
MKNDFHIKVETMHVQNKVDLENVHQLPPELLEQREVIVIDIANDPLYSQADYKPEWDPKTFQSKVTGLGPLLGPKWWENTDMPIMCAYKLVTCEFKWFGLQTITERFIQNIERRIFLNFHRQLFCSIDSWHGFSMNDIRALEEQTKKELDKVGTVCEYFFSLLGLAYCFLGSIAKGRSKLMDEFVSNFELDTIAIDRRSDEFHAG